MEWFALRDDEVAHAATGALRKALIKQRQKEGDLLAIQYGQVRQNASDFRALARSSGHYPLLSGGRINLYSLFVERAMGLVNPDGFVGLLTPSGIYADKTAARFFKSVSTDGRVSGLFDFENRKIFFKDVHASFKFCVLVFGGEERRFDETECAFFLHDTETIKDAERCFPLAPGLTSRQGEPEHGHISRASEPPGRRHHSAHLRAASCAGGSVRRWGAACLARAVHARAVQHDV